MTAGGGGGGQTDAAVAGLYQPNADTTGSTDAAVLLNADANAQHLTAGCRYSLYTTFIYQIMCPIRCLNLVSVHVSVLVALLFLTT